MGIQVKFKMMDKDPEDDVVYTVGDVMIKANGRVLFQSVVQASHFWGILIEMIENFIKKEKKTISGYYHTNFCIEKAKRKDELIFSIESPERRERVSPIHLNKKEFFEKSLDCALAAYGELLKMDSESQWGFDERIQHILELKKRL